MSGKEKEIFVTKYDGRLQLFDKSKVYQTCVRMGATNEVAKMIADKIEKRTYDEMSTKKILGMIFSYMKRHKPALKHTIDLRKAITMLRPKPDFELFVAHILRSEGYDVESNVYMNGEAIQYEIDAVAVKGDEKVLVEVKHHYKPHTYTGLDVFLEIRSKLEDLLVGYSMGKNDVKFTKAMVVSNTKMSDHGRIYADCKGIDYLGWKAPVERGLERIIETRKMHPTTFLKDLHPDELRLLGDAGIVTIKQVLETVDNELAEIAKMPRKRIAYIKKAGREILSS